MKLSSYQLSAHLKQNLSPAYLVSGDEPLLVQEAADEIRTAIKAAGFNECLRFTVDSSFDWSLFREASVSGSLFSEQQLIELRLMTTKLGDVGRKVLEAYFLNPPSDKRLLLIADKLDAATQKTVWFKTFNKVGVFLPIWPLQPAQLPTWIEQRLRQLGFSAEPSGVKLLAELTEGNLLSTAQCIEKLSLLYPKGTLTFEQIREMGADSARYNVFDLVDKVLHGEPSAILRVLRVLREEAIEPTLILWAITKEVRTLIPLMQAMQGGQSLQQVLNTPKIWEKRRPLLARALKSHSEKTLYDALQIATQIDLLIKGMAVGSVWDALSDLSLATAGIRLSRNP